MAAPAQVLIHKAVIDRLKIRTEPVYRIRARDGVLEIGPVIGMLLGPRNHWYDHRYLFREAERVTEVYPRTGGLLIAFSPRNYSAVDDCAYGLFFDPPAGEWRYSALPVPAVLHRRSFQTDAEWVRRIEKRGTCIFNSRRYTKWELHQVLSQDAEFRNHLPETVLVHDGSEVFPLLERHGSIIVKPSDLSRGRGILFVRQDGERYDLTDCRESPARVSTHDRESLQRYLGEAVAGRRYLAQEKIDLAKIGGAPFDIRVVMQRGPRGAWACTGIECRLAGEGQMLTNIAQGGRALWLHEAIALTFGPDTDPAPLEAEVRAVAAEVCRLMDETGERFGEWGMDLAFDRSRKIWFIETNVVPSFKGFTLLDRVIYRRLLAAPLLYANFLAGFGGDRRGANLPGGGTPKGEPKGLSAD